MSCGLTYGFWMTIKLARFNKSVGGARSSLDERSQELIR